MKIPLNKHQEGRAGWYEGNLYGREYKCSIEQCPIEIEEQEDLLDRIAEVVNIRYWNKKIK